MKYAKDTDVSVAKSRAEIEATVTKYGAHGFISGWQGARAMVAFEMRERRLKFILPLPDKSAYRFTPAKMLTRTDAQINEAWEQACRQKWRALALLIKAKLEAVESDIGEFDTEFLANIVMPDGMTVGERMVPQLSEILANNRLPPLLPGPGQSVSQ